MLLLWGTLQPYGSSKLASVRFSGPVRIRSIRVFPKGASLFVQNPEAISQTEPDAFTLSVFFNAQAAPSIHEPKPKGTNVLVPTKLQYPGGLREFPLDMGPDFVTRLMVVQGDFVHVTLAVYGDAASEPPLDPVSYEPTPLTAIVPHALAPALDPANSNEPTLLSRDIINLIPHAPLLPTAIRLIFCLKPADEDYGGDRFSSLDDCIVSDISGLEWLERAAETLMAPLHEDVSLDLLKAFSERISDALIEKTNDHLYALAGLLRYTSAQPETVVRTILESLDLSDVFEMHLLDKHILERLHDAAANPTIAHALGSTPVLATLQSFQNAHAPSRPAKLAAAALQQRVLGWGRFEKALSSPQPDLVTVAQWIKELASEDMTFGVFLVSMLENDASLLKVSQLPIQEPPVRPTALWSSTSLASFYEFVAFLRAFLGIAHMMAVMCWANHVADTSSTERILAMLRLWQEVEGYREIVNHLLLLPQVIYRLEGVLRHTATNPSLVTVHVEQVLTCLCTQPESMIRPELANLVDALPSSCSSLSEDERSVMMEIVGIAEGGVPQAIRTLLTWSGQPVDTTGGRALQAALLVVNKTLNDPETGEWKVMQAAWKDGAHGLVYHLVELLGRLVGPIHGQFLLVPPSMLEPSILTQLISSSQTIMRILSRLLPGNPLPSRMNRALTHHVMTLFIATDAVDSRYPQGSATCQAARVARPTCADTLSVLSSIADDSSVEGAVGETVLRTLLHIALYPEGDDPVARLEQAFWLLDLVLPLSISDAGGDRSDERFWTKRIIPNVLPELQRFSRALAIDQRMQLVERLTALDRGEVGLGQWFVDEELKHSLHTFNLLVDAPLYSDRRTILQARATNSLQFLTRALGIRSTINTPDFFHETRTLQDVAAVFAAFSTGLATIPAVVDLACAFAPYSSLLGSIEQLELALTLLRGTTWQLSALSHVENILPRLGQVLHREAVAVAAELGPALHRLASKETLLYWQEHEVPLSQAVMSCIKWLLSQPAPEVLPLPGISEASFAALLSRVMTVTSDPAKPSDIGTRFAFSNDIVVSPVPDACEPFTISCDRLLELATTPPKTPPTPRLSGESIFKMATISPITALVGASRTSTLTKTYQNNDFRQLSVRQNTSRRPSMHVDVGI
ncbi:hypothetical protein JB92DRAFT_3236124 [Gautieria morchelliformis]|nr:hypothetical protein JB92DRAFT_3236124 [Gautieria morchelliformis]